MVQDREIRWPSSRRRREVPYIVVGIAIVVLSSLFVVLLIERTSGRVSVLALARDVPVGQPLVVADLRVEQIGDGTTLPVVRAEDAPSMLGRLAAVPLRTGRLLAADDVGSPAWPPIGQVLAAVAVAPGTFPPELAAGMHVLVGAGAQDGAAAVVSDGTGTPASNGLADAPEAVVAGIRDNPAGTGGAVVSLLLPREAAGRVTALPASQLRLVVLAAPAPTPAPAAPAASPPETSTDGGG